MSVDQATRRAPRPLPGVSFETPVSGRAAVLPRLDVTGFVGYAEAGPLDIPVLVHDHARFLEIFGGDLVLADAADDTSPTRSGPDQLTRGLLGPTVRAFFDNGGRACWVVRVGVDTSTSQFVVTGLVAPDAGAPALMRPVVLQGRSPGAFLDGYAAVARVRRRGLPTLSGSLALAGWVDGSVVVPASVRAEPGELLELVLDTGRTIWVPLASRRSDATGQVTLGWSTSEETWLDPVRDLAVVGPLAGRVLGPGRDLVLVVDSLVVDGDGRATCVVELAADQAPTVGDVVEVRDQPGVLPAVVLTVDAAPVGDPAVGPARCVVTGWPAWRLLPLGTGRAGPVVLDRAAVLELDLATRSGDAVTASVEGLGFVADHPRWVGALPTDRTIFRRAYREAATGSPAGDRGPLDGAVDDPRFALAAPELLPVGFPARCLPLGLGPAYGASGVRPALTGAGEALARNGAASSDLAAFVDERLSGLGRETLLETARRRFLVEGEDLRGLHALLPVEDVAVVAVPDALLGSWRRATAPGSPVVLGPHLSFDLLADRLAWDDPFPLADAAFAADQFVLERSVWPDFATGVETTLVAGAERGLDVDRGRCGRSFHRVRAVRRGVTSPWSNTVQVPPARGPFDDCDAPELAAPSLGLADLLLTWTPATVVPAASYEVQRRPHPLFERDTTTTTIGSTTTTTHLLLSRPAYGTSYARVRQLLAGVAGPWSVTVAVSALPATPWVVTEPDPGAGDDAISPVALDVHRALATMAAARQDLTVLVSFPRWYGVDLVERHLGRLADHFEYLHAHHPWGLVASTTAGAGTVAIPADGAVAGRLARGSIERGPWVATAGAPLAGMLGVATDRVPVDAARLRTVQVNGLVLTRRGVMLTGVDTLAPDRQVRPVTVRRLLILVRRLALREGREIVFEPNRPDLRRLLQTRFESALGLVFRLGGLAGASTTEAYRVLCDEGLNPPRVTDAGQVVVELQLAPSYPLEFLVVRLVQADDGGFQLAEVAR